jgi:hypothetical protein
MRSARESAANLIERPSIHEAYRHYRTIEALRNSAKATLAAAQANASTIEAVFRVADRELARIIHDRNAPLIADGRRGNVANVGDSLMVRWSKIEANGLTIIPAEPDPAKPNTREATGDDAFDRDRPRVDVFDEMDRRNDLIDAADFEAIDGFNDAIDTPIALGPKAEPIDFCPGL